MPDLVEWLETAISGVEDHQRRRTVSRFNYGISCPTCGRKNASVIQVTQARVVTLACGCMFEGGQVDQLWVTAPTPDAAWVLRRCAADRKILDMVRRGISGHPGSCVNSEDQDPADYVPWDSCERHIEWSKTAIMNPAVQQLMLGLLAEGYGYQEETDHG